MVATLTGATVSTQQTYSLLLLTRPTLRHPMVDVQEKRFFRSSTERRDTAAWTKGCLLEKLGRGRIDGFIFRLCQQTPHDLKSEAPR